MDFLKNLSKFVFPLIQVIIGILLLTIQDQDHYFIIAGLAIVISGIVSGLFVANFLSKMITLVLQGLILIVAVYFAYQDYKSVDINIRFARQKSKVDSETIQRLKDVRTAEKSFLDSYGHYTADLDSLVEYVNTDSLIEVRAIGDKPDSLTIIEAIDLGIIQRDTFKVSVLNNKFLNESALKKRKYPFDSEKFIYAPYSGERFKAQAGVIEVSGGIKKNVLEVVDPSPIVPPALKIGSMVEPHINGNWRE